MTDTFTIKDSDIFYEKINSRNKQPRFEAYVCASVSVKKHSKHLVNRTITKSLIGRVSDPFFHSLRTACPYKAP